MVFLRFHVLYLFRVLLPVHCACPSFSEGVFGSNISLKSTPKGRKKIVIEFDNDSDVERFINKLKMEN